MVRFWSKRRSRKQRFLSGSSETNHSSWKNQRTAKKEAAVLLLFQKRTIFLNKRRCVSEPSCSCLLACFERHFIVMLFETTDRFLFWDSSSAFQRSSRRTQRNNRKQRFLGFFFLFERRRCVSEQEEQHLFLNRRTPLVFFSSVLLQTSKQENKKRQKVVSCVSC